MSKQFCSKMKRGSVVTFEEMSLMRPEMKAKWFKTVINHDVKHNVKLAVAKDRVTDKLKVV